MTDCTCGTATATATTGSAVWTAASVEPYASPFPVPEYPPASWFMEKPEWLTPDTKIAVDDAGRVAGYFYHSGQCLVHDASVCPAPSPTGYSAFHQQEVVTNDGEPMRVGVIGNTNGHANPYASVDVAQAHYADPDRQLMSVRAYDDEHGGFILGAMVPRVTFGDVALVRRSALSGDWRPMPPAWWQSHNITASAVAACEGYDCIGPTLVTRPGLPLVRRVASAIIGGQGGVMLDERERQMTETTIDLGNGVRVTTNEQFGAPGPHPVAEDEARTAAPFQKGQAPPTKGGGAPPAAKAPGAPPAASDAAGGDTGARLDALEQEVAQIKDVLGQLVDAVTQPMAAAAELPPPRSAAPAGMVDCPTCGGTGAVTPDVAKSAMQSPAKAMPPKA